MSAAQRIPDCYIDLGDTGLLINAICHGVTVKAARFEQVQGCTFVGENSPAAPVPDLGVPGATLTVDGKKYTVDEVHQPRRGEVK